VVDHLGQYDDPPATRPYAECMRPKVTRRHSEPA
jgi:hypothetical protein